MNNNQELAKIFNSMANYLEMDEVSFRSNAYRKVAVVLETLGQDVEEIEKLENISGVGKHIAQKIEEYLKTGKIEDYEKLKKETPIKLEEIIAVEGMGIKKAKILYEKLKVKNLKDLEKVAKNHKIALLEGFGEKSEKNILQGITFLKRSKGRFLLNEADDAVRTIFRRLEKLKEIEKISIAGSLRRRKETIGDIDILAISKNSEKVMAFFVSMPEVIKIWSQGPTRSSIRLQEGIDVDLRVVPAKSYGSALQYFTGSKEHNIITRKIAISKGLKLNEYGVFKKTQFLAGKTEEEVYNTIGLEWIPPELRESELDFKKIPSIIESKDIRGDLHCHSDWNGGNDSIETIAERAIKMGYEYIGISDHTQFLKIEHGLNEKQLLKQKKEIDEINSKFKIQNSKFKILWGCEANILTDGSVDISDEILKQMDYVIASVHSSLKMDKDEMTQRIIKAMKNPNIDIIAHLTGRLLQKREECKIDLDQILKVAKETGTILEINSSPIRLDLKDSNIKKAKKLGIKMIISSDAHDISQLDIIKFGVDQARRGWAEKKDIINTQPLSKLLKHFK